MGKIKARNNSELQPIDDSTTSSTVDAHTLFSPGGYFAAYGRNLSLTSSPHEAWWETEKQFNRTYSHGELVYRRFLNFNSFRDAFRRWQKGEKPDRVVIHIQYVPK